MEKEVFTCPPGKQLSAFLRENGTPVLTRCGGHGNCGKCKVKIIEGSLPVMTMDKVHLTEAEIDAGIRLACQALPKMRVTVEIL